jgi:hypothetical protein
MISGQAAARAVALVYELELGGILVLYGLDEQWRCRCRDREDCTRPGKHPRNGRAHLDALDDETDARDMLRRYRPGEINLAVRPAPGLVVLDIDPRHGGDATVAELEDRLGPLPETLTVRTGGGGRHLWLTTDTTGPIRGRLGDGLDVKTSDGYLVIPPSRHVDRRRYAWEHLKSPAEAPRPWAQALAPAKPPARHGTRTPTHRPGHWSSGRHTANLPGLIRWVADAHGGERNNRLYGAALCALNAGYDTDEIEQAAHRIGVGWSEIRKTVRSARQASVRAP